MNALPFSSLETEIVQILARYPVSQRSAAMPVLHLIQERYGHISDEAIAWAAKRLGLEPIHLLELVTFYPMYRRQPVGKYHLKVCRTLSCALNEGERLREHLLKKLGVGLDEVTPDGRFTLSEVECLASCGTAPVLMINDAIHEKVTPEKADEILSRCV